MSEESELHTQVETHLRTIWKGGSEALPMWTPEQIQTRALQFERKVKWLAIGDRMGFLLIPLIVLGITFTVNVRALAQQAFGRIEFTGAVLLVLCSVVGFLIFRRHSYAAVMGNANDLLASHLERLARLRDWYASTPWGAAMYLPGAALVMIGVGMSPTGKGWEMPIIWSGIAAFAYIVACVQTKLQARWLQREIDSLKAIRS